MDGSILDELLFADPGTFLNSLDFDGLSETERFRTLLKLCLNLHSVSSDKAKKLEESEKRVKLLEGKVEDYHRRLEMTESRLVVLEKEQDGENVFTAMADSFTKRLKDLEFKFGTYQDEKQKDNLQSRVLALEGMEKGGVRAMDTSGNAEENSPGMQRVQHKLEDLENRSRRCNLVFSGIPDSADENPTATETKISSLLKEKLHIEDVSFVRIHRVGRYVEGRSRVIVGKLADERKKVVVLRAKRGLRGSPFYIDEDFGFKTREARAHLRRHAKMLQSSGGGRYNIVVDMLKMDGKIFRFDHETKSVYEGKK